MVLGCAIPQYIHLLWFFLCSCSSFYSFCPQFPVTSDIASSFTAAPLTYAQYFLDKVQLSAVLLPTVQTGSIYPHVLPPLDIKWRAHRLKRQSYAYSPAFKYTPQVINSWSYVSMIRSTAAGDLVSTWAQLQAALKCPGRFHAGIGSPSTQVFFPLSLSSIAHRSNFCGNHLQALLNYAIIQHRYFIPCARLSLTYYAFRTCGKLCCRPEPTQSMFDWSFTDLSKFPSVCNFCSPADS
jgi:hypothetical protein